LEILEAPLTYPQGVMISLRTVAQMNLCWPVSHSQGAQRPASSAVELMPRGWEVTGVEIVPYALRIACERALRAGVRVHPFRGDVAALRAAGVGFGLVLDFGYVHGPRDEQRIAMGEVSAVVRLGATTLMITSSPLIISVRYLRQVLACSEQRSCKVVLRALGPPRRS
jgi:hypothetical protein